MPNVGFSDRKRPDRKRAMPHIDVAQARQQFDELIKRASQGEDVVITKENQPFVRLTTAKPKRKRQFGSVEGEIWMSDDFDEPLEDFRDYME